MSGQVDVHKDRANYKRPRIPYKVLIAGEDGVGKTSLFKRMLKLGFNEDSRESRGIHEEIFDDDETIIPLDIWDTADMKNKYDTVAPWYYRGIKFVLLVYSADDEYSLHKLSGLADTINVCEPSAKLILVKNKIDLPVSSDTIPEEWEKAVRREVEKKVIAHFSTSAKTSEGVDELLKELAKYSLQLFNSNKKYTDDDNENNPFRLDDGNHSLEMLRIKSPRKNICNLI